MDIYEARRQFVLHLVRTRFDDVKAKFADATGISRSYVNRMLKDPDATGERKRIGDDVAIQIEDALSLQRGEVLNPVLPGRRERFRPDAAIVTPRDVILAVGRLLGGLDEPTRDAAAALLNAVGRNPADAPYIAQRLVGLLGWSDRNRNAANDSRPGDFIDTPVYRGPERRVAAHPVSTDRRRTRTG